MIEGRIAQRTRPGEARSALGAVSRLSTPAPPSPTVRSMRAMPGKRRIMDSISRAISSSSLQVAVVCKVDLDRELAPKYADRAGPRWASRPPLAWSTDARSQAISLRLGTLSRQLAARGFSSYRNRRPSGVRCRTVSRRLSRRANPVSISSRRSNASVQEPPDETSTWSSARSSASERCGATPLSPSWLGRRRRGCRGAGPIRRVPGR